VLGKIFALALVVGGFGCIDSQSVQCGFGLCPPGSQCDEAAKTCIPPGCGDGIVSGIEQCDGDTTIDPNLHDCETEAGAYAGTLRCSSQCTIDTSGCKLTCGDHEINGPELCDGIPPAGATCSDFGFEIGRLGCTLECAPGFGQCASIGWERGHGNAPDELHAVWGDSATNMFTVGRQGAILHSDGLVWLPMTSPTTEHLNGIWGTSTTNILAVGDTGTILRFDGTAWSVLTSGTLANLHAVNGTKTDVWIVGDGGAILHASITGEVTGAFAPEPSGVTVNLRGVWAENATLPIAVGDAATMGTASPTALARTSSGWTAMTVPAIQPVLPQQGPVTLAAVWGLGASYVAVGSATTVSGTPRSSVLQVNNVTTSPTFVFTGQSLAATDLKSVYGVQSAPIPPATVPRVDIFIGGVGGTMLHYTGVPGPAHFRLYESNTTRAIAGLWGTGPAFIRAATVGGEIQEYDGTDVAVTDLGLVATNLHGVYQDDAANLAVAVGESGTVVRHDFTGWLAPQLVGAANIRAVTGVGSTVFIASNGLAVSANDGASFGGFQLAGTAYNGLWATSATDAWAVGDGGAIAHYNGTWTPSTSFGTKQLNAIWGSSNTDIFVVGNAGTIGHFDGGAWTAMTSPVPQNLNAVWGSSGSDVFVAGGAGVILHYDGTSWHRLTSGTGQDLNAVGGTSHADVFVGGRGTLLKFGGAAWFPIGLPFDDVFGLWIGKDDSFFVGNVAKIGTVDGAGMILGRTQFAKETGTLCADPWDNDYDGLLGCSDHDCNGPVSSCNKGGVCGPSAPLVCGQTTIDASTYTGIARIDDLPCLDHATPGPEASYRIVAPSDGMITVTLDDPSHELALAMLSPFDPVTYVGNDRRLACDVSHCVAASAGTAGGQTLTFAATAGETYYFLVDGPQNTASEFTLSISCP
jgi:hypothetical protein